MEKQIVLGKFTTPSSFSAEGKEFPPMPRATAVELGHVLGRIAGSHEVTSQSRENMMKVVEVARRLTNHVIAEGDTEMTLYADTLARLFETFGNELATLPPFNEPAR